MKAIVQHRYGSPDVLVLQEIEKPVAGDDQVLVRVRAASVGAWDWHSIRPAPQIMRLLGNGLFKPRNRIPGLDLAGQVEAVGKNVTQFQPGDPVYGESEGAFAEYVSVSEGALAPKPANLTFEQAAAVPVAASTALIGLRDEGEVQAGQRVLIIGAAGGVGTFAVQIAKSFGAEVTGVCSTKSVDLLRSIGADRVIDYTQESFCQDGVLYDLIFELAGAHSLSELRGALAPDGTLVMSDGTGGPWIGPIGRILKALVISPFVSQTLRTFVASPSTENLLALKALIEAGTVTPVIERTYPLSEVPEAIRYLEEGHAQGKTVITV